MKETLIREGLDSIIDVIILSDHGMMTITPRNFINLYEFIDSKYCQTCGGSPVLQINCTDGKIEEACRNLTIAGKKLGVFNAYTDDELLERWHIRNKQRFGPCTVVAEPGYAFQDMYSFADWFENEYKVQCTIESQFVKYK